MQCNLELNCRNDVFLCNTCKSPCIRDGKPYCNKHKVYLYLYDGWYRNILCNCDGTEEFGDYTRMAIIKHKDKSIQVDECLKEEIEFLLNENITTISSCCGHGKTQGYIAVIDSDIDKMKELGYKKHINPNYPSSNNFFIPKYKKEYFYFDY